MDIIIRVASVNLDLDRDPASASATDPPVTKVSHGHGSHGQGHGPWPHSLPRSDSVKASTMTVMPERPPGPQRREPEQVRSVQSDSELH